MLIVNSPSECTYFVFLQFQNPPPLPQEMIPMMRNSGDTRRKFGQVRIPNEGSFKNSNEKTIGAIDIILSTLFSPLDTKS